MDASKPKLNGLRNVLVFLLAPAIALGLLAESIYDRSFEQAWYFMGESEAFCLGMAAYMICGALALEVLL